MRNQVILIGYVGSEAEVRVLETGDKLASFSLATNERYTRRDGTSGEHVEWHSIVAWRDVAAAAERWAVRGAELYVEGAIRSRSTIDPKTKQSVTRYEIIAKTLRPADDSTTQRSTKIESPIPEGVVEKDPDGLPF